MINARFCITLGFVILQLDRGIYNQLKRPGPRSESENDGLFETDSECIPRRLAAGLASEYKERLPYVKIPCGLCRRVLHSQLIYTDANE
jgi:hypothetical protein